MYLLLDNYDSFTYNIYNLARSLGADVEVYKNDEISCMEIEKKGYKGIILSPGPSRPENAGNLLDIIRCFYNKIPILGICLGHQAIGLVFGGDVVRADRIMHGKVDSIIHMDDEIFSGLEKHFDAVRYHSLVVKSGTLSEDIIQIASSCSDNEIMAIRHREYPLYGLQFHPESFMTPDGHKILTNFFKLGREYYD